MTRRSQTGRLQRLRPDPSVTGPTVRLLPRPVRVAAFAGVALLVAALAVGLVVTRVFGPAPTDADALVVQASMGGFEPATLTIKSGQSVRVELASLDTPFHSDGGGWHQFAVDELGIDWQVGPQSSEVFELTAPAPGTYTWYCDVCCGGKENPAMRGTLTVEA